MPNHPMPRKLALWPRDALLQTAETLAPALKNAPITTSLFWPTRVPAEAE